MYYIGLDVHKKTISYCVKDASGQVHQEGMVGAARWELDDWMKALPQPWTVAMEATVFTGWIYDHLLPHAQQVKVAHPLMLRAISGTTNYCRLVGTDGQLVCDGEYLSCATHSPIAEKDIHLVPPRDSGEVWVFTERSHCVVGLLADGEVQLPATDMDRCEEPKTRLPPKAP